MKTTCKNLRKNGGFIMPVLLFSILLIAMLITVVMSLSLTTSNLAARDTYRINAQLTADAGLDLGLSSLNTAPGWTGSGGEITLLNTGNLETTYETILSSGTTSDRKVLAVTAKTYAPSKASNPNPKIIRKYEVDIQAVTTGTGPSAVVTGVGGLILNNNAKITGGDVVVNGTITLNNNAQIGLSSTPLTNAVNIRVAHTNCPVIVDLTYPRVCAAGENGQPITIGTNGKIYADARATNQTTSTNMFNPGLKCDPNPSCPGPSVSPITLPAYDRDAQKTAAEANPIKNTTDTDIACGNNQTKNWPANVKITGNISMGNNCTINLSGNAWITGNLTFGNNSKITVPDSLGATMPVIMVDGSSGITINNNGTVQTNSSGTGIYFIAYWANSSCSPDCNDVTGADLKNSQDVVKINLSSNGSAPGSILYARWSRVSVANNGAIGAVAGQSILLGENAVINFTASIPDSDNLTTTWVKRGYMRVFN